MSKLNVYSFFYDDMKRNSCNSCECKATFIDTNSEVTVYAHICEPCCINVHAIDGSGVEVWRRDDIDVTSEPEDCPFINPKEPICNANSAITTNTLLIDISVYLNEHKVSACKCKVCDNQSGETLLLDIEKNEDDLLKITTTDLDGNITSEIKGLNMESSYYNDGLFDFTLEEFV